MMTRALPVFAIVVAMAVPIDASADDAANEALARRFYAEFNVRDFEAFYDFVSADFVDYTAEPVTDNGVEVLRRQAEALVDEIPDVRMSIQLILVSGDHVTVVARITGTSGGMMPADQRPIDLMAIDVWLVADGMLSEAWRAK